MEGAYWAVATHPLASESLFNEVFGYIHMLSHLVGASNRADLKRLLELETEKDLLLEQLNSARRQMRDGWASRDKELQNLRALLARQLSDAPPSPEDAEASTVRKTVKNLETRLNAEKARRTSLEARLAPLLQLCNEQSLKLERYKTETISLKSEIAGLEQYFSNEESTALDLQGKTVLYVGGVAKGIKFVRAATEKMGASFLHHDGGQEQATILLRGLIGRADIVLVPLDFVSHEAALICKSICQQQSKPFFPLAHAGVGSVLRILCQLES